MKRHSIRKQRAARTHDAFLRTHDARFDGSAATAVGQTLSSEGRLSDISNNVVVSDGSAATAAGQTLSDIDKYTGGIHSGDILRGVFTYDHIRDSDGQGDLQGEGAGFLDSGRVNYIGREDSAEDVRSMIFDGGWSASMQTQTQTQQQEHQHEQKQKKEGKEWQSGDPYPVTCTVLVEREDARTTGGEGYGGSKQHDVRTKSWYVSLVA